MEPKRGTPGRAQELSDAAAIADQAALWLARRDRGLTAAEQDDYMQWLTADSRHAEALAQHAAAFERMMKLYEWQPGQSTEANPDLFAPQRAPRWRGPFLMLAAAAALAFGVTVWRRPMGESSNPPRTFLRVNERQTLTDGSTVDLKDGSRIFVEYSEHARRVRLIGEAHFTVASRPVPFVVIAGGVAVRAVGTAFNVRLDSDAVDVLVTKGRVAVAREVSVYPPSRAAAREARPYANVDLVSGGKAASTQPHDAPDDGHVLREGVLPVAPRGPWSEVAAGQRAIVPLVPDAEPRISDLTTTEIDRALGWHAPRLQFFETPLAQAVEEFNRHSAGARLVVADPKLGAVPIGGTFRVDNPEGFVRMLELTLSVRADPRNGEIVLSRSQ